MTKTTEYLRSRLREAATAVPTTSAICCDEELVFSVTLRLVLFSVGDDAGANAVIVQVKRINIKKRNFLFSLLNTCRWS